MKVYKLGTRGSPLALKQADMLVAHLSSRMKDVSFEIVEIRTTGDKRLAWSLERMGGKGLFTKEIEEALLNGDIDLAVHSAKDMPTDIDERIPLAGYLPRDNAHDVLIMRQDVTMPKLIATGSPRRRSQLKKMFPQAVWTEIRGNVATRLQKIVDGAADATILSKAGLDRLGIDSFEGLVFKELNVKCSVPAVGQGAIVLQCRAGDLNVFKPLTDEKTNFAVSLERLFLKSLGGGCQVAYCAHYDGEIFHFYHEDADYQRVNFEKLDNYEGVSKIVEELATGLLEKGDEIDS